MTEFNQPQTPFHGIPGAINPPGLPERRIIRRQRRRLSNGRLVEFRWRVRTGHNPDSILTAELIGWPETDCNCAPIDIADVYACCNQKCQATVCGLHIRTCQACGIAYCTACVASVFVHGFVAVVCRPCAKDLKRSKLVRFLLKLFTRKKDATWLRTTE